VKLEILTFTTTPIQYFVFPKRIKRVFGMRENFHTQK